MKLMAVRSGHDDDRPFVGRHRELEALIHEPGDGRSARTVVVAGEAGLGKTRLVDRAIDASGVSCVVRGFAVPRSTPIPLELVWSALGPDAGADGEITHRGLAEREP